MDAATQQLIEEHVRRAVVRSIEQGVVLDVDLAADLIARAHGLTANSTFVKTELAKAAVAAQAPMLLPATSQMLPVS